MDLTLLAQTIVTTISPFIPKLLDFGGKVTEGAAKKIGEDAWNSAKTVWSIISAPLLDSTVTNAMLMKAKEKPASDREKLALQLQIETLLETNDSLKKALDEIFDEAVGAGRIRIQAIGDRSIAQYQNWGTNITGDIHPK